MSRRPTARTMGDESRGALESECWGLVERAGIGITVCQDGRIVYANPAMGRLLGYTTRELYAMTPEQARVLVRPVDRAEGAELPDGETQPEGRVRVLRKDGEERWLDIHAQGVEHEGRGAVMTMCIDVTDREAAVAALGQSEQKRKAFLESAASGIVAADGSGCITYVNAETGRMFGYSPDELVGQAVEVLVPEDSRSDHVSLRERYMKRPRRRPMGHGRDLLGQRKDGTRFPVEVTLSPVRDGGEDRVLAIITDITERKKAEETLRMQTERLETVRAIDRAILKAESSPAAIAKAAVHRLRKFMGLRRVSVVLFDRESRSAHLLAQSSSRRIGVKSWTASWDQGFLDQIQVLSQGKEFTVPDINDRRHMFDVCDRLARAGLRSHTALPLSVGGELIGALYLWSDEAGGLTPTDATTGRGVADQVAIAIHQARLREQVAMQARELEERVELRTAELAEVNRELDAFAYSVSHDLRAPLRAMQGFGQALLEDYEGKLDSVADDFIKRIVDAAGQMDELIQDLLAYSRMVRSEIDPAPTSIGKAVDSAIAMLEGDTSERRAVVRADVGDAMVMAEQHALEQVLVNLIGNGVKFAREGVVPRVTVRARKRGNKVRITVRDNGIGIHADHQHRIFKMFERLHGTEAYPGTGIGLALVQKVAERLGGGVGVESTEGKGSTFWVELVDGSQG